MGMGFPEDAAKAALEAHGSAALDALLGLTPVDAPHQQVFVTFAPRVFTTVILLFPTPQPGIISEESR